MEVMKALDRKYGSDHKREMYRMELKGRYQKGGETLQEFASAVERLVHFAHANTTTEYMERIKIDAFIDGIRDPETRKGVMLCPKRSFAETVAYALTYEMAQAVTKQSIEIRRVEIDTGTAGERLRPRYREGGRKMRCWTCGDEGHISPDCRERRLQQETGLRRAELDRILGEIANARKKLVEVRLEIEEERRKIAVEREKWRREQDTRINVEGRRCVSVKDNIVNVRSVKVLPDEEWTSEMMRKEQIQDPDLSIVIKFKENGHQPTWDEIKDQTSMVKSYLAQWDRLCVEDGCLKREWESNDGKFTRRLLVVPNGLVTRVLERYHEDGNGRHVGVNEMLSKIRRRFYWSRCRPSVVEWCRKCEPCAVVKEPARSIQGRIQPSDIEVPCKKDASDQIRDRIDERRSSTGFDKGQLVWLRNTQRKRDVTEGIQQEWEGRQGRPEVVHFERLARYREIVDPVRDEQA